MESTLFTHQNPNTQQIALYLNVPYNSVSALTQELSTGSLPSSTLWFDTSVIRAGIRSQWGTIEGRTNLFQVESSLEHLQATLFNHETSSKLHIKWESYTIGESKEKISVARIGVKQAALSQFLSTELWNNISDITSQWEEIKSAYEQGETKFPLNFDLASTFSGSVRQALGFSVPKPRVTKEKKSSSSDEEDGEPDETGKKRLNPAHKIYYRILHDPTVENSLFTIGYSDRFSGVKEVPFDNYVTLETELFYNSSIPFHRIQYFKYRGHLVWDRKTRVNLIDGNGYLQFDNVPEIVAPAPPVDQ